MRDVDRFDWERAIRGSGLHPTTRHVLLTVGTYMNRDGTGARPTQATLAAATGLTDRAVRKHLGIALELGWLERTRQGRGVGRDGGMASEYEASTPEGSAGTTVPPDDPSTGTTVPPDRESQPERGASQPERGDVSAGTTVPPTMQDHGRPSSSSEEIPDHVKVAARREIHAKRARGEVIRNEHGLFVDICRQLLESQRLDTVVHDQAATDDAAQWQARIESMQTFGTRRARLYASEHDLLAELADEPTPALVDIALAAFRQERTVLEAAGATP